MFGTLLLLAALLAGTAGCGGERIRSRALEPGRSPVGVVFIVHGIWPDSDRWWVPAAREALRERRIEPVPVTYRTFVLGYLRGHGIEPPTRAIVAFADEAQRRHARTGCETPLRFAGVGYSAGSAVLLQAAERGVPLERVYFAGSPVAAWSRALPDAMEEEAIGAVVNYWSLFDGAAGAVLGSGQLGFRGRARAQGPVENRHHLRTHLQPVLGRPRTAARIADELAATSTEPPHTCYDDASYARWFLRAKARLARGEEPRAPARPPGVEPARAAAAR